MTTQLDLKSLTPTLKSGDEPFYSTLTTTSLSLLDYWRWSASDLVSNATRGVLAEFIVATALDIPVTIPREEWAAWDLTTPEGIRIEVKSTVYVQSWSQKKLSTIAFNTPRIHAWDATISRKSLTLKRQADVYVLALLAHQDKATIDPLNLDQWTFFVLPTAILDGRERSQNSITLPSLLRLHGPGQPYARIRLSDGRAHELGPRWSAETCLPA